MIVSLKQVGECERESKRERVREREKERENVSTMFVRREGKLSLSVHGYTTHTFIHNPSTPPLSLNKADSYN